MPFLLSESTSPFDPLWENTSPREILFTDPTVTGYETLIASTPAELQVVVLDPNRDAITQISEILSQQKQPLDGLHILSHAQSGMLHLGSSFLSAEALPEADISQWAKSLTPNADILLYGCNLAADFGVFVDRLAAITGADVAASDNLTGSAALGGDWELEAHTGPIEVQIPFSAEAIAAYQNVLAPTDLFISEYVEGSSNNKALEFYNGTGSAIDLEAGGYSVEMYFNGNTTPLRIINLTGTIAHGSTFVLAHNMANLPIVPNQTNNQPWYDGNDAIVLRKNGIILDAIGQVGFDPGTAWTGGGVSTLDRTLRRKITITTGDTNPNNTFNPSVEWSGFPQNTFSGLGRHNDAPQVTLSIGNLNYTENDSFAILDPSATASDPDSTNFNGGTLTINFTSGATSDDILMIRNQGLAAGQIAAGIDSPGLNLLAYSGIPFATFTGGTQGTPLTIKFTTNIATNTAVSALMRNIIYGNISENPSAGDRTVQFQLTDPLGLASSPASKTIAFTTANDAPIIAVPGASFALYDGTNTPNTQDFEYRTLPYLPIATTQNGINLNTSGTANDYAGYIARPDRIPLLDRNTGYTIDFTAQILAENHNNNNNPSPDKNGDGIADRAGFSLIAISSDGQKGIEIGFWEDRIWVQEEGAAEPPVPPNPQHPIDSYTLFTHKFNQPESVAFDTTTNSVYQLKVLGNTYQLLANGNPVISGNLRDYTSAILPSFLPENPYTTPNFIFFGDNTPSASANFNLSAVSVTTGSSLPLLSVEEDTPLVIPGISVADADAGTNPITVTLAVNQGTLTVNSGVTGGLAAGNITANGTNSVTLTGTISQINQVLADAAGLLYQGLPDFNGSDILTIVANDGGNSGSGGALIDTQAVNITVNPVNDAPVLTPSGSSLPPLSVDEDTPLVIPGISVADADAGTNPITVTLAVNQGTLTVNSGVTGGLAAGSITANGTNSVTLTGTISQINQVLADAAGVIYQGLPDFNGSDILTIVANDGGNSGSGGALIDTQAVNITVNPVNDAPVLTPSGSSLPPLSVDEDTPLVIPGISVADADAGTNQIIVTLAVNQGTLTVNSGVSGGLAVGSITANGTNSVTLTGTISQINQVLADAAGLRYQGLPDFNGSDILTIAANDGGNSGSGGALIDTQAVNITVNPVNDAPVLTLPTNPVVDQSVNLSIPGISVADLDAGTQPVQVTLSASNGFLTLDNFLNLTFVNGDGSGDAAMSFTGTLGDINSALNTLIYQSGANYFGADTINITVNDLGNTGTGNSLEVSEIISLTVNPKGELTLTEHSATQILDQFPPASSSVPDDTVLYRFRLSAVNQPIITNTLTFGVTTTGIGNTNVSNLQLINDVNNNGIYDIGDLPVGTMEMPLDITDGVRVSTFTVPVGDNNYLLIGGLNGLQEGSTVSVALNSSNIVAANGNSIPISTNGTVSVAAHIVEAIVIEPIPPADNSGIIPPADNSGIIPPADNSGIIPPADNSAPILPADNSAPIPPADNSGIIPPADNSAPILPADNSGTILPADNSAPILPADNSGTIPPVDNSEPIPPADNSGIIPPADNSEPIPPADNSGTIPPVMVGGGESNGLLPLETDTVGESRKPCCEMNLPESPNFLTVGGYNQTETMVIGSEEGDLLLGGHGDDALFGSGGDDQLYGENGDDHLYGADGNDKIRGGIGSEAENTPGDTDRLEGGTGSDELHGNQGDDTIFAGQGDDTVYGGKDEDLIWGDRGSDILYGNKGSDTIFGGSWTESALPTDGGDILYGNEGDDYLSGNEGNDTIYSGQDNDIAWGGADHDLMYGDRGSDTLIGDAGDDTIYGGPSDPSLADQDGDDYISGGSGNDFINGNQGADIICAGEGDDTIHGGKGNDFLAGDSGNDILIGDQGDDILCGGDGDDTLIGGSGSDRFILGNGQGTKAIADFESGIDQLTLADNLTWAQLSIQSQGGVTTISSGGKVIAILQGVTHLTAQDLRLTGV